MPLRLELRPAGTIIERYLEDLAERAGLPRPGILAASASSSAARSSREGEARSLSCDPNKRSAPSPLFAAVVDFPVDPAALAQRPGADG
jgi:hypothetical protein